MNMVDLLTSRCSILRQNVGWLQDIEDNSWELNVIIVPFVNEQILKLGTIIRNDEETTDEAILRALKYCVRVLRYYKHSLPFIGLS